MSFPVFGVEVENGTNLSSQKFQEFGTVVGEDDSSFLSKVKKGAKKGFGELGKDISQAADIAKQAPVSLARGLLTSYGDLEKALGVKENLPTPMLEALHIMGLPRDLPTSDMMNEALKSLGIEPEAKTGPGRMAGAALESLGGAAAFGANLPLQIASLLGGTVGQGAREAGLPEGLATGADILTTLSGGGIKAIPQAAKALKKIPEVTKSGLTKLKGIGKAIKTPKAVSQGKFVKTSEILKKDIKKAIGRLTDEKLPFSKIAKGDPEVYSKFDKAFEQVRGEASKIEEKAFGGEKLFSTIDSSLKEARKIPSKSPSTKGYIKELSKFRQNLSAKELSASQWEKQYREINKGIRNLSKTLDQTGEKSGRLSALHELNKLTADSIETNFKNNPSFTKPFKSLNKAYSNFKDYESVNKLIAPTISGKYVNPNKFISSINSQKGQRTLTSALGKDGYKEVQNISKDLADVSDLFKMFNVKKDDWKSLAPLLTKHIPIALVDLFSKGIGKYAHGILLGKQTLTGVRKMMNNMLLSPAGRRNWKEAVSALKNVDKKAFNAATAKLMEVLKKDPEDVMEETTK